MQLPRTFDQESVLRTSRVCSDSWSELKMYVPCALLAAEHVARDVFALSGRETIAGGERDPDRLRKIALGSGCDPVVQGARDDAQAKALREVRA